MTWPDGRKYEGEWCDDQCNGNGSMQFEDKGCYRGEFLSDKMHGNGIYTYPDGQQSFSTVWISNEPAREGTWTDKRGAKYDVVLRDDVAYYRAADLGDAAFDRYEPTEEQRAADAAAAASAELATLLRERLQHSLHSIQAVALLGPEAASAPLASASVRASLSLSVLVTATGPLNGPKWTPSCPKGTPLASRTCVHVDPTDLFGPTFLLPLIGHPPLISSLREN